MKTMNGSVEYPMTERIADTIEAHGWPWAYRYYVREHGFASWEFYILAGVPSPLVRRWD